MPLHGVDIICFGFAEWDNPYRTNQHHIAARFARENRLLFVESPGLRRPALQKKDVARIFRRLLKWLRGVRRVDGNLSVFAPLVLPFHKYRIVRAINRVILRAQLDRAVKKLGFKEPLIWSYVPNAVEFLGRWKECLSVYHCVDELTANPRVPAAAVGKMEKDFIERADIVIVTSRPLYESKKTAARDIRYMPNVADYEHFSKAADDKTPVPPGIAAIPRPRAGFIGAVSDYKLDFSLIENLASARPDISVILAGPTGEGEKAADLSSLERFENIYILGGKPYGELPGILKSFDVCLLPSKINDYTRNMFPMKFFEYLSAGKPVVATRLAALADFGRVCYFADDGNDFAELVSKAVEADSPEKKRERMETAKRFTWDARMDEISRALDEKLSERRDESGAAAQ